jgi:hypothetical protein
MQVTTDLVLDSSLAASRSPRFLARSSREGAVRRIVVAICVLAGSATGSGCEKPPQRAQSEPQNAYLAQAPPLRAPVAPQEARANASMEPSPCGLRSRDLVGSLTTQTDWEERERIFADILRLNDPRSAGPLFEYIQSRPHPRLAFLAAVALANVGDVRSVEMLARRLRSDDRELPFWARRQAVFAARPLVLRAASASRCLARLATSRSRMPR